MIIRFTIFSRKQEYHPAIDMNFNLRGFVLITPRGIHRFQQAGAYNPSNNSNEEFLATDWLQIATNNIQVFLF